MTDMRDALERLARRALERVRGEPSLEWLVGRGMQLGKGTHIAHPIYFDRNRPWLITIDDYVTLGPYVAVITHDASLANYTGTTRIGRVVVEKRAYVGVGAVLLPGTTIGADSVVGAGAVVHGEIPPGSLVTGNPAQVSSVKPVAAWHRASARRAPSWPREGWTQAGGITEERKLAQREALAGGASGYVPARPAPGSPYAPVDGAGESPRNRVERAPSGAPPETAS